MQRLRNLETADCLHEFQQLRVELTVLLQSGRSAGPEATVCKVPILLKKAVKKNGLADLEDS